MNKVTVIGAGLAGCEAAWQLAQRGIEVDLIEMRPYNSSPAHKTDKFAELICSNSLRSSELTNAAGLLKEEMRRLGGLIIECADTSRVPAGGALAVDREGFSALVTERIKSHPRISVLNQEVCEIPSDGYVIVATGPLTSDALSKNIQEFFGGESYLNFYDAAAPIVSADSLDYDICFEASRYNKGDASDYINCPFTKEQYDAFYNELINAKEAEVHGFEDKNAFEGCMPIEVMARRGYDTIRFGPMKPVGITDPKTGKEAYAVVQLRRDNASGTMLNIVGFQTHLLWGEQKRVFSMIPGLSNAEFLRYGVMHRNSFINSPKLLDKYYAARIDSRVRFAGQLTGVEGYIESTASGFLAGIELANLLNGEAYVDFPPTTAIGALALYVSNETVADNFQPMNINFGIMPQLEKHVRKKREKRLAVSQRSLDIIDTLKDKVLGGLR